MSQLKWALHSRVLLITQRVLDGMFSDGKEKSNRTMKNSKLVGKLHTERQAIILSFCIVNGFN